MTRMLPATFIDIERSVRQILAEVTRNDQCVAATGDASLAALGVDSIEIIELIYALEDRFSIEIADEEVVPESFQSVRSLTALVIRKCS